MTTTSPLHHHPTAILVTGGAGFIGHHVIERIVRSREWLARVPRIKTLVCLDRLDYVAVRPDVRELEQHCKAHGINYAFVEADITSPDTVLRVLREYEIDTVIHMAAQTSVDESFDSILTFTHNNVLGTNILLEACRMLDKQIKRFLYVSTDEVYGESVNSRVFTEEDRLEPTNPYAATKASAECLAKSYYHSFKIPVVIARPNNVFGPRQFPEKVIPKFIRQIQVGNRLTVHGDGSARRCFIFAEDVAELLLDFVLLRGRVGEVYNCGDLCNREVSVRELAGHLLALFGITDASEQENRLAYVPDRLYNDSSYLISSRKVADDLGWGGPRTDFLKGLETTVAWYKEHAIDSVWSLERNVLVAHPKIIMQQNHHPLSNGNGGDRDVQEDIPAIRL